MNAEDGELVPDIDAEEDGRKSGDGSFKSSHRGSPQGSFRGRLQGSKDGGEEGTGEGGEEGEEMNLKLPPGVPRVLVAKGFTPDGALTEVEPRGILLLRF